MQPDRAIRCAAALADEVRSLGIQIRSRNPHRTDGVTRGQDPRMIAVVIGARVMSLAGAGEILVTTTTKELVTGSGFAFEDFSAHELKGVPGTWQVFAVTVVDDRERTRPLPAAEAAERRAAIEPSASRSQPRRALIAVSSGLLLVYRGRRIRRNTRPRDGTLSRPHPVTPAHAVVEVDPERDPPMPISSRSVWSNTEGHRSGRPPRPTRSRSGRAGSGPSGTAPSTTSIPAGRSCGPASPSRLRSSFSFDVVEGEDKIWVAFDGGLEPRSTRRPASSAA